MIDNKSDAKAVDVAELANLTKNFEKNMRLTITEINKGRGRDNRGGVSLQSHITAKHQYAIQKDSQFFAGIRINNGELVATVMIAIDDVRSDGITLSVYRFNPNIEMVDLANSRELQTTLSLGQNIDFDTYSELDYFEKILIELN